MRNTESIRNPSQWSWAPLTVGLLAFVWYFLKSNLQLPPTSPDTNIAFQHWFRRQGGWISPKLSLVYSSEFNGNGLVVTTGTLREGDVLLEIPKNLLFTQDRAMLKFSASVRDTISRTIQDPLDQQDVWIAMDLMLECAKGNDSLWLPYIQVLPSDVPRLATFSDQELQLLQDDDDMAKFGASQRHLLHRIWIEGVRSALRQHDDKNGLPSANGQYLDACRSESSFHRFVALSSSRAMILGNDIKYLSPMAEMINHADRPEVTTGKPTKLFQAYHKLENEKLVVYADRNFHTGDMVVEEYGQLDNSLYITAFGFVPSNNPHHCVLLPLPNPEEGTVCVDREGRMDETSARILAQLACNDKHDDNHCEHAAEPGSPEHSAARAFVKRVAQTKLAASPTNLADDERILQDLERTTANGGEWRGMNRDRARLALQFRIEEKKVLLHIANLG